MQNIQNKVSIIGLGLMGSTLARILLQNGYHTTVWNRTIEKAEPLVRDGAVLAGSVASAVSASPIVIVCVYDYASSKSFLEKKDVIPALSGKILIQLSTGSPKEARDSESWTLQEGAKYLDGAIMAIPSQMGRSDTTIFVSGAESAYRDSESVLKILAGNTTYLGKNVGSASALDLATLSYLYGAFLGFLHGALIAEKEGIRVDSFGATIASFAPILAEMMKHEGKVIQSEDYVVSESSLKLSAEATQRLLQTGQDAGMNVEFPKFTSALFKRAMDEGYGEEEIAALIKVLRKAA